MTMYSFFFFDKQRFYLAIHLKNKENKEVHIWKGTQLTADVSADLYAVHVPPLSTAESMQPIAKEKPTPDLNNKHLQHHV